MPKERVRKRKLLSRELRGDKIVSLEGTGLTVQQLLDSSLLQNAVTIEDHSVTSTDSSVEPLNSNYTSISVIEEGLALDDEDLFQCGKCKAEFTSLRVFLLHKQSQCSVAKVKKEDVAAAESSSIHQRENKSLTGDCDSPTSLNQQVTSSISTPEVVREASSQEQNVKYEPPDTQSVVVNDGEFFDLALDGSQVFKLNENLQLSTTEDAASKMIEQKSDSELFAATDSLVPEVDSEMVRSTIVTEAITESVPEEGVPVAVPVSEVKDEKREDGLEDSASIVTELSQTAVFEDLQSGSDTNKNSAPVRNNYHHVFFHGRMAKSSSKEDDTQKMMMKHHCSFCSKAFSKNFDLQQHIRSHTGEKPFQCIVCGRAFAQKSNVKKHMITHRVWPQDCWRNTLPKDPIKKIIPDAPEERLTEKDAVKEEVLVDDSYVCPFCSMVHPSYLELRSHMKHHNDQKVYRCIQKRCEETFVELDAFLEHIRIHEKELQYRCHTCSKVFNSLHSLGYHQFEHSIYPWPKKSGPSYFRCTKCMNKYASAEALDHHLKVSKHHFPCKQCSRIFFSERLLRTHLRVHGNVNLYTCTTCCKDFKSEHSLKVHQLIHTGERPFECQICTMAFNRKDRLKRHLLVHEAKKFKCPFSSTHGCNREFRRNDKLRLHIMSHAHSNHKKRKNVKKHPRVGTVATNQPSKTKVKQVKLELAEEDYGECHLISENETEGANQRCKKSSPMTPSDPVRNGLRPQRQSYEKSALPCQPPTGRSGKSVRDGEQHLETSVGTKIRVKRHSVALIKKEDQKKQISSIEQPLETPPGTTSNVCFISDSKTSAMTLNSSQMDSSIAVCRSNEENPSTQLQQQIDKGEEDEEFIVSYSPDEGNTEKVKGEHEMKIIYFPFSLTQDEFLSARKPQQEESEVDGQVLPPSEASISTCASTSAAVVATEEDCLSSVPPPSAESTILLETSPSHPPPPSAEVIRLPDNAPPFFVSGDEAVSFVTASSIQNLDNLSAEMLLAPPNLQVITTHAGHTAKPDQCGHLPLSGPCRISIPSTASSLTAIDTTNGGGNSDVTGVNNSFFVVKESESGHSTDYPNYSFRRKDENVGIALGNGRTILLENKDGAEFCIQSEFLDDADT